MFNVRSCNFWNIVPSLVFHDGHSQVQPCSTPICVGHVCPTEVTRYLKVAGLVDELHTFPLVDQVRSSGLVKSWQSQINLVRATLADLSHSLWQPHWNRPQVLVETPNIQLMASLLDYTKNAHNILIGRRRC